MAKYFVYISGPKGPERQIWYGDMTDGNGKEKPCLQKYKLPVEQENWTLQQLSEAYPYAAPAQA